MIQKFKTLRAKNKIIISIFLLIILNILYYLNKDIEKYIYNNQIDVDTGLGNNQGYHPKILSFEKSWNGYKYWMAFTPYPKADSNVENPTINVSNDLFNWRSPNGIKNPLDSPQIPTKEIYNSDSHLLFNKDTNELEIFWRRVEKQKITIFTKKSKDGIHWTKKEIFLNSNNSNNQDYMSPSINYENGTYQIWYVHKKNIYYTEKKNDILSNPRKINITYNNNSYFTWHFDIILNKEKNLYEIVSCAYTTIQQKIFMPLFYTKSKDNIIWDEPIQIMEPSIDDSRFDSQGLYRSSLIYENKTYYLFYSAHDKVFNTGIGLRYGSSINKLKPYLIKKKINNCKI